MADTVRDDGTFMFDRAAETMAHGDLAALQLRRLQQTIARAHAKVPHYRRKLDGEEEAPDGELVLRCIELNPDGRAQPRRLLAC